MPYTIEEHKHISAAWGAATGARASKLCRFSVSVGKQILEGAGFSAQFTLTNLPLSTELDQRHAEWRQTVIELAAGMGLPFTHGIAAKLINGYLKDRFVCGGYHEHERVKCLHPPIDALLLGALAEENVGGHAQQWREFRDQRWSKFDSAMYQAVINLIRESLPAGEPLWKIEQYWRGHQ